MRGWRCKKLKAKKPDFSNDRNMAAFGYKMSWRPREMGVNRSQR